MYGDMGLDGAFPDHFVLYVVAVLGGPAMLGIVLGVVCTGLVWRRSWRAGLPVAGWSGVIIVGMYGLMLFSLWVIHVMDIDLGRFRWWGLYSDLAAFIGYLASIAISMVAIIGVAVYYCSSD